MMPGTSTADVGKNQFIQHQTELEDALRQLAKALGMEHMLTDSPHFSMSLCRITGTHLKTFAPNVKNKVRKLMNKSAL